jgi:hypothetical protein
LPSVVILQHSSAANYNYRCPWVRRVRQSPGRVTLSRWSPACTRKWRDRASAAITMAAIAPAATEGPA